MYQGCAEQKEKSQVAKTEKMATSSKASAKAPEPEVYKKAKLAFCNVLRRKAGGIEPEN
jgi:hypothetical protein